MLILWEFQTNILITFTSIPLPNVSYIPPYHLPASYIHGACWDIHLTLIFLLWATLLKQIGCSSSRNHQLSLSPLSRVKAHKPLPTPGRNVGWLGIVQETTATATSWVQRSIPSCLEDKNLQQSSLMSGSYNHSASSSTTVSKSCLEISNNFHNQLL